MERDVSDVERVMRILLITFVMIVYIISTISMSFAMVDANTADSGIIDTPDMPKLNSVKKNNNQIILPPEFSGYRLVKKEGDLPEGMTITEDNIKVINTNTQNSVDTPPELQNALQEPNAINTTIPGGEQNNIQQINQTSVAIVQNTGEDRTGKFLLFLLLSLFLVLAILLYLYYSKKMSGTASGKISS